MSDKPENNQDEIAARQPVGLSQIFGLDRQQINAIAELGFKLYGEGRIKDAENIFDGLVALDSHVYYGYAGLGAMALAEEKLEGAIRLLLQAAKLNPGDPAAHANLGEALIRQARFEDAAAELARALKLDPEKRDAGADRARTLLKRIESMIEETRKVERA